MKSWAVRAGQCLVVWSGLVVLAPLLAAPAGTQFTYQGRLKLDGAAVNTTQDVEFRLYDALTAGNPVGTAVAKDDVPVANGLFTVELDFGAAAFVGDARWLEIAVRPGNETGAYTTLTPRQPLTVVPYALHSLSTAAGGNNWSLTGNAGTTPGTHFLGTSDSQALEFKVNSARALRLEPHDTSPNVMAGFSGNVVSAGVYGAAIGGGGKNFFVNRVTDSFGTVAGGYWNQAGNDAGTVLDGGYAAVGGGDTNVASGSCSTVPGGRGNSAAGECSLAAGRQAQASHQGSFVWADTSGAAFASTGNNQFLIRAAGNVGINKNDPGSVLDVNGTVTATAFAGSGAGLTGLPVPAHSALSGLTLGDDHTQYHTDTRGDARYWRRAGNAGTTPGTDYLGTSDDQSLEFKVNGLRALRLEPHDTSPNVVAGFSGNVVSAGVYGAAIGGGGKNFFVNRVTDSFGTVAGGYWNQAGNDAGTVLDGGYAAVGGGDTNVASGSCSTVPGGRGNSAAGECSLAAGRQAQASHQGSFVWADTSGAGFASTANNQYLIRAAGNVGINKNNPGSTLDVNGTVTATAFAGSGAALTGLWSQAGNAGTTPGTHFLGTSDNQALELKVNATRILRLEPNATSPNVLGGYSSNSITSGVYGATVSGGGYSSNTNQVTDDFGTVGGGAKNRAGDSAGTTADRTGATVGGGTTNTASGSWSTVSGGESNTASGGYSAVPGGTANAAAGDYSLAAGRQAKIDAAHDGTFLWADQNGFDFASAAANEFAARATGGVRLVTGIDGAGATTAGVAVAAGGGSWSSLSDRAAKENVQPVDGKAVLAKLLETPIATWNYKAQDDGIRHIGPMAQDFAAAFRVGEDDRHITTVDADGVALAAIQGLHQVVQEKDARIAELEQRLATLEAAMGKLLQQPAPLPAPAAVQH